MKSEKFTGSAVDQLESVHSDLLGHRDHFVVYGLVDLSVAVIRCSSCQYDVVSGSREFVELLWLNWSMAHSE